MLKKVLLPALGCSILLVAFVYGCYYIDWSTRRPPDILADVAINGETEPERELAAAELTEYGEDAKDYMREVLAKSNSPKIRATCIQGLGNIYDYESIEVFFAGLEDESSLVRGRSAAATQKLIGRSFHFDPNGPEAERAKRIAQVKREWEDIRDSGLIEQFIERMKRKQEQSN